MIHSQAEALLYHFANNYLRDLLPDEYLAELTDNFTAAERLVNETPETLAWSQRVLWLSHWDGVLTRNTQLDAITKILSTALFQNRQVIIHYSGNDKPFQFNLFGLIKRDQNLLVVGSYGQNIDPFVLAVRKILAVELTNIATVQPASDFDIQEFLHRQLNFSHYQARLSDLQIEFSEELYSYVIDNPIEADLVEITPPADYQHAGFFLMKAQGVVDGERLRQWIRGFSHKAQVLKPDDLRLVMELARLDTRTSLLAATEFKRRLKREVQRYLRDKQMSFALLILDLDHFKQVNDNNGHSFGDEVLLNVANCIREYDEATRYGGEEFTILLPNTNSAEAQAIAERIRLQIAQQELTNQDGKVIPVTASIGLAIFPDDLPESIKLLVDENNNYENFSELMADSIFNQADLAVYQAKDQGRNRVCLAPVAAVKTEI